MVSFPLYLLSPLLLFVTLPTESLAAVPAQQTLRGAADLFLRTQEKSPPSCSSSASKDPEAFGRNDGHWEQDMFRAPLYDASTCSYMQSKFTCGAARSARINRWAWRQAQAGDGTCHNTDFAHDGSAAVNDEFLQCTANKTVVMMGDSNTRNSFVGLLCRFHKYFPPYVVWLVSSHVVVVSSPLYVLHTRVRGRVCLPGDFGHPVPVFPVRVGPCMYFDWGNVPPSSLPPRYVYSKNNAGPMEDRWMPPAQKKLKPGDAGCSWLTEGCHTLRKTKDPLYRDSHYTAFNGLSLHFSSVYFSPKYDFPSAVWKKKTAQDIIMLPLNQLLPKKHVDFLVVNIGIHLQLWCDYKAACIRKTYQGPVQQVRREPVLVCECVCYVLSMQPRCEQVGPSV